jgi:hypothetical protein
VSYAYADGFNPHWAGGRGQGDSDAPQTAEKDYQKSREFMDETDHVQLALDNTEEWIAKARRLVDLFRDREQSQSVGQEKAIRSLLAQDQGEMERAAFLIIDRTRGSDETENEEEGRECQRDCDLSTLEEQPVAAMNVPRFTFHRHSYSSLLSRFAASPAKSSGSSGSKVSNFHSLSLLIIFIGIIVDTGGFALDPAGPGDQSSSTEERRAREDDRLSVLHVGWKWVA